MTEEFATRKPRRRLGLKLGLVAAGFAAGAVGATAIGANAQTSNTATTPGTPSSTQTGAPAPPTGAAGRPGRPAGGHGAAPVRGDENAVSATLTAQLKAAALKAVPGGIVYPVETDAGDGAYEAHMTKSDGTEVTVKFDKNYKVIGVEAGMGKGDPAGPGH